MRLAEVVHPQWLSIEGFEDTAIWAVAAINNVYAAADLKNRIIPSNVKSLFLPFKLIAPTDVKAVMLGIEPPFGFNNYTGDWYYTGIPYDTPPHLRPNATTRRMMKQFGIEVKGELGYLSSLYSRGLLLTNAALTCTLGYPRTHLGVWQTFTRTVLQGLAKFRPSIMVAVASSELFRVIGRPAGCTLVRVTSPSPSTSEAFLADKGYDILKSKLDG